MSGIKTAIAKWESGENVPTIEKLIYLVGLYEVTLDELVGRIVIDKYAKAMEYIKEFAADDIPTVSARLLGAYEEFTPRKWQQDSAF